jgi:MFS family permease
VAAAALPAVGWVLDTVPFPIGYQLVFAGSFLAAMASTWVFSRVSIPDQVVPRVQRPIPNAARLQIALSDLKQHRVFALYLVSITVFRLGLTMPRPLWSLFWVNDLHLTDSQIGLATTVVYIVSIIGYFLWGRVASRRGHGPVLVAATLGLGMYPLVMGLAQGLPAVLLASCFGGMFTAAYSLVTLNLILALAPPAQRANYAALNAVSLNSMALMGPLLGSALAESLDIRTAMLLAAAVRFLGGALFIVRPVLEEPSPQR